MSESDGGIDLAEIGSLRRDGERLVLTQRRVWSVDRATLWVALTAPQIVTHWLGTPDAPLSELGEIDVEQGRSPAARLVVTEVVEGERLVMSWQAPREAPADVVLAVRATDDASVHALELTYAATDEDQVRSAAAGWLSYLDVLGEVVGAGPHTPEGVSPATNGIMRLAAAVELGRQLPIA
ncbi:MAG: SRPBCC family protein [Actinomycetaceae bacterium]